MFYKREVMEREEKIHKMFRYRRTGGRKTTVTRDREERKGKQRLEKRTDGEGGKEEGKGEEGEGNRMKKEEEDEEERRRNRMKTKKKNKKEEE